MRSERLVALLFTLQSRRSATVPELAAQMEVSERTVHRDIAALRDWGVPLWTEPGRGGGVRLVDGWRSRLDGLTTREAVALLTLGAPRALAGLGLGTAASAAHAKVAATLPGAVREQAQQLAERFHLDAPGWFRREDESDELATLTSAVWSERRVRARYGSGDGQVDRVLSPLGLVLKAGTWYLVALRGPDVRTYRVGRFTAVEALDERFERPAGFDLAAWWAESSAEFERTLQRVAVRARLSPRGLRALPRVLDADVARAGLAAAGPPGLDGWAEVELRLEEPAVAAGQLLALGDDVEVLGPPEVRSAFVELLEAMLARHR
ncbi:helix-turn-helix transcriptional regulator [Motilibacter aurantiacus]|uniref:helix-turn-helix transcriptional regulator n=1 Tax=Motilibacter aurantiacus TaxID=2714955 RepID=UPI00140D593A|nr:WYL domain-containing protein [Motilibacter aurantiacus]NHC44255.1 WYL domain-containing protein [Motilibacter aurantiacus]